MRIGGDKTSVGCWGEEVGAVQLILPYRNTDASDVLFWVKTDSHVSVTLVLKRQQRLPFPQSKVCGAVVSNDCATLAQRRIF